MYDDSSHRSLNWGLLHLCHEDRSPLRREAWGLVGGRSRPSCSWWQEERVSRCFPPVWARFGIFSSENPFMSSTVSVSNRHCISLWFRYDPFPTCHIVIPYRYVDSSYRSGSLLHLCHEEGRSSLRKEAYGLVGGISRASSCSWWQKRVSRCLFPVCVRFGILLLENPFMSPIVLVSNRHSLYFPMVGIRSFSYLS